LARCRVVAGVPGHIEYSNEQAIVVDEQPPRSIFGFLEMMVGDADLDFGVDAFGQVF